MHATQPPREQPLERLAELGQQLRVDAVRCAANAGSGHPTSAVSAADLAAVPLAAGSIVATVMS